MNFVQQVTFFSDGSAERGMVVGPFDSVESANEWTDTQTRTDWEHVEVFEPW